MHRQAMPRPLALKTLCGLAVATALLAPSAHADEDGVILNGRVRIGIASVELEGVGPRQTYIESAGSFVGIKGQESLPDGYKAFFDVQTYLCADEQNQHIVQDCGTAAHPKNGFASREGWLGLRGGFGELKIGRGYTPLRDITDHYDNSLGLGTGLAAWVENTLPQSPRLNAAAAAAAVAAYGPLAQGAAEAVVSGINQQLALGGLPPQVPTLGRNIEPQIIVDNAVRYSYGDWDGLRFSALASLGENKTTTRSASSRISASIGYATGKVDFGQFSIDLGLDQTRNVLDTRTDQYAIGSGLAMGSAAVAPTLSGVLQQQGGLPAQVADAIAAAAAAGANQGINLNQYQLSPANKTRHVMLGTSYIFPFGLVALLADHVTLNREGLPDTTRTNWSVNWAAEIDNVGWYVGYRKNGQSKFGSATLQDSENKYSVGGEYRLSKRTKFVGEVDAVKIEGGKVARFYVVGLDHKF